MLRFYKHDLTQTEIAAYGTDGANEWNWLWGESSNPTRRGIDMILNYFANLATTTWSQSLTAPSSETLMLNRQMFFIRWGWDSGGGHFVIPKAISGTSWTLMDPWYGPTVNTYSWVLSGSSHTWTHSLSVNSAAPFPRGDIDASGMVNLSDVIRALQIASGCLPAGVPITKDADVDGNGTRYRGSYLCFEEVSRLAVGADGALHLEVANRSVSGAMLGCDQGQNTQVVSCRVDRVLRRKQRIHS